MPMSFPDFKSLEMAAKVHQFRAIRHSETIQEYRKNLADHVASIDFIESCEIRNGAGWDQFTDGQNKDMLRRQSIVIPY